MSEGLVLGDAMIELARLKEGSVDLLLTDPPYRLNYTSGSRKSILFIPKVDRVQSIVSDGQTDVYDLSMADPHPTFVANGIIVHNCAKTSKVEAAARRHGLRMETVILSIREPADVGGLPVVTPDGVRMESPAWAKRLSAASGPRAAAERMAERGGFGYGELIEYLGREPETWSPAGRGA